MGLLLFRRRASSGPFIQANSPKEKIIRSLALVAVFTLVIWAFWANSKRNLERIQANTSVVDETQTLSQEQRSMLMDFVKLFKSELGLIVKIRIDDKGVEVPELDSKTIFFGLNPARQTVMVEFPPLVAKALGAQTTKAIKEHHFRTYFETGDWHAGLALALERVWLGLTSMEDENQGSAAREGGAG